MLKSSLLALLEPQSNEETESRMVLIHAETRGSIRIRADSAVLDPTCSKERRVSFYPNTSGFRGPVPTSGCCYLPTVFSQAHPARI